jgi:hypothetical protein
MFGKRKVIYLKEEDVPTAVGLANKDQRDKDGKRDLIAHRDLWLFLEKVVPEVKKGQWEWHQWGSQFYLIQTSRKDPK